MFGQHPAVCRPPILLVGFISHLSHIAFACPACLTATEPSELRGLPRSTTAHIEGAQSFFGLRTRISSGSQWICSSFAVVMYNL